MAKATCSVDTCDRPSKARGWCYSHWDRWRRLGDVQADRPLRARQANGASVGCRVDGCGRSHYAKGLCRTHNQYLRQGQAVEEMVPVREMHRPGGTCAVSDCPKPSHCLGLCTTHYCRKYRHGSTTLPQKPPKEPVAELARLRAYQRAWKAAEYHRNRDAVIARRKAWQEANAERMKLHDARKRYKRRGQMVETHIPFSVDQLSQKIAYWGNRCWVCKGAFEAVDHMKPVSKGGPHMLANLRPICRSCNSRKRNHWPYEAPREAA